MMRFVNVFVLYTVFVLTTAETDPVHNKSVMCYVEYGSNFKIEKVDLSLCTHLIAVDHIWGVKFETEEDPWTDPRDRSKDYKRLTKLRRKFPHLKISLALKHNFRDYLLLAKSNERNQTFIRKATSFVLQQKFDGLDLLWDFSRYQDQNYKYIFDEKYDAENFLNFLKELKTSFGMHNISLTTTFIAANEKILENIDPFHLSNHFHFVHFLQWYVFDGPQFGQYQQTLEMRSIQNMKNVIDCAIALGVPRSKIIMAIQLLPTVFDHFSSEVEKFNYAYVCDVDGKYDVTRGLTTAKKPIPILWTFLPEHERYIFESMHSVANKVRFAIRRDLGGIMAFSINFDDFDGKCSAKNNTFIDFKSTVNATLNIPTAKNTTFPLLHTINEAIILATPEKEKDDLIKIENNTDKSRQGSVQDKIVMCYTLTRPDRKIITVPIESINLNLCTHLICIDNIWNTTANEEPWQHVANASDYERFTHLRQKYPQLKIIMAVKHSFGDYLKIVNDSEHRSDYITNATDFVLNNSFDGLELFMDLPIMKNHKHHLGSHAAHQTSDKDVTLHFMEELKANLYRNNKTLTAAFTGVNTELAMPLNVIALSEHLDLMNFVPMYNFRGHSGNVAIDMLNITKTEQFFDNLIDAGVLRSKLIMGISFLGHSFTHKPDIVQFEDTWSASYACEMSKKLKVANLFVKKDPQQKTTKSYSLESENGDSIRRKIKFVKSRNLAGVSAFPVNFDDFLEKCEEIDSKNAFSDQRIAYPLLWTINKSISDTFLASHATHVDRN